MRWIALLLIAALAGCTTVDDGDGTTGTGTTGTGTTGTTGTGTTGTTGPGQGFAPQSGHDEEQSAGIHLEGTFEECEAGFCLDATATNVGNERHVSDICVPPWSESMERDGMAVQHREPMGYCAAFGTAPMGPGNTLSFEATWNGTVWDDARQRYEPAPAGGYDWMVSFRSYAGAGGEGRDDVTVSLHVLIGAAT